MHYIFSSSDLLKMNLDCLPRTRANIANRAKSEGWLFQEVRGKGGKGGIKRVYQLPDYVLQEIKDKGLDQKTYAKPIPISIQHVKEPVATYTTEPAERLPLECKASGNYAQWRHSIKLAHFVPVRYYPNLRVDVGHAIDYDEQPCKPVLFGRELIFEQLNVNPANIICIPEYGDSMEPTIRAGAMVMVNLSECYSGEGIYLIRQGQTLKIKRLQQIAAQKILLISDNKEVYTSIEVDLVQSSPENFAVLGKYLWHGEIAK